MRADLGLSKLSLETVLGDDCSAERPSTSLRFTSSSSTIASLQQRRSRIVEQRVQRLSSLSFRDLQEIEPESLAVCIATLLRVPAKSRAAWDLPYACLAMDSHPFWPGHRQLEQVKRLEQSDETNHSRRAAISR
eukprot:12889-Heterococcus_DN1.PRE.2